MRGTIAPRHGEERPSLLLRFPMPLLALALWAALGAPPPPALAGSPAAADGGVRLAVTGDRLTARLDDVPLRDALAGLAGAIPLRVTLHGDGDDRVSAGFAGLTIEDGVRRILRGHSYVLIYASTASGLETRPPQLAEVVVLGRSDRGGATAPTDGVGPDRGAARRDHDTARVAPPSPVELGRIALTDARPELRSAALRAIARRGRDDSTVEVLTSALADPDDSVRLEALELFTRLGARPRTAELARLLHDDASAPVRREAATMLAAMQTVEASDILRTAIDHRDPAVRKIARSWAATPPSDHDASEATARWLLLFPRIQ